jgi:4-aminobutyrate aminotransferase-like enzyme
MAGGKTLMLSGKYDKCHIYTKEDWITDKDVIAKVFRGERNEEPMTNHVANLSSTQSRSTRPGQPLEIVRASGAYEFTADGRKILSWPSGQFGPLLGYPSLLNPLTTNMVMMLANRLALGDASLGSYPPEIEGQLADRLIALYQPYLNSGDNSSVRFMSNGTDSTQTAVALARYETGRSFIVSIGYHGGSSPVFGFPPQNGGLVPMESMRRVNVPFDDYVDWWSSEAITR